MPHKAHFTQYFLGYSKSPICCITTECEASRETETGRYTLSDNKPTGYPLYRTWCEKPILLTILVLGFKITKNLVKVDFRVGWCAIRLLAGQLPHSYVKDGFRKFQSKASDSPYMYPFMIVLCLIEQGVPYFNTTTSTCSLCLFMHVSMRPNENLTTELKTWNTGSKRME